MAMALWAQHSSSLGTGGRSFEHRPERRRPRLPRSDADCGCPGAASPITRARPLTFDHLLVSPHVGVDPARRGRPHELVQDVLNRQGGHRACSARRCGRGSRAGGGPRVSSSVAGSWGVRPPRTLRRMHRRAVLAGLSCRAGVRGREDGRHAGRTLGNAHQARPLGHKLPVIHQELAQRKGKRNAHGQRLVLLRSRRSERGAAAGRRLCVPPS